MAYKNIEDRRAYHREYMKERREWLKSLHYCVDCGKQDAYTLNNKSRCFECTEKKRINSNKNRNLQQKKEYYQKSRQNAIDKGLCTKCNKRIPEIGRKLCSVCIVQSRKYQQEHRIDISRSERFNYNLCYKCGNQLDGQLKVDGEVSRLCSVCYSKMPKHKTKVIFPPICQTKKALENYFKIISDCQRRLNEGIYDKVIIKDVEGIYDRVLTREEVLINERTTS